MFKLTKFLSGRGGSQSTRGFFRFLNKKGTQNAVGYGVIGFAALSLGKAVYDYFTEKEEDED